MPSELSVPGECPRKENITGLPVSGRLELPADTTGDAIKSDGVLREVLYKRSGIREVLEHKYEQQG